MLRRLLVVTACCLTIVLGACRRPEAPAAAPASGTPSPDQATRSAGSETAPADGASQLSEAIARYEAVTLEGNAFRVGNRQGKVVLLNVWATWCGPCRYEIPELKRLHDEYASRGFEVIGVTVDVKSAEPSVREFVDKQQIAYPILLDPESRIMALLRTTSIPTSVLIDRQGRVVWQHIGIVTEKDPSFREALDGVLGG